jgi:hypothetical protein
VGAAGAEAARARVEFDLVYLDHAGRRPGRRLDHEGLRRRRTQFRFRHTELPVCTEGAPAFALGIGGQDLGEGACHLRDLPHAGRTATGADAYRTACCLARQRVGAKRSSRVSAVAA